MDHTVKMKLVSASVAVVILARVDYSCAAKKAVADRVPLDHGRLRKHEFRELMNAVIDALPPPAESLDAFLSSLRSSVTVSVASQCLVVCRAPPSMERH